ncbi:MAG: Serine/threonine-protein kinase PrkC [Acidimicrobiales bacterium]|nr:Serine/threonine-protein kinase PrkC [Acidimicrobiales bacterium]
MTVDHRDGTPVRLGDRYRLVRPLGSGGMADVWEATDERLHRDVAVKVLRQDPGASPEDAERARRRFTDEGRLIARHSHPNIVSIFDAGEDAGRAYLVMEWLPGMTLADRLAAGPLGDDEARALMTDVLAGLGAAHRAGVVHRDVKPGNVLLDTDGTWKVADFGIATEADPAAESGSLTRTGQLVGTPRYTAPERFAGLAATTASDIYSAGVLLRDAIAGRDDADPVLRAVASRAASLEPTERFASAPAMAAALGHDGVGATVALPLAGAAVGDAAIAGAAMSGAATSGAAQPTTLAAAPVTQVLSTGATPLASRRRLAAATVAIVVLVAGVGLAASTDDRPPTPPTTAPQATSTVPPATTSTSTTAPPATTVAATAITAPVPVPATSPAPSRGRDKGKDKRQDRGERDEGDDEDD